MIGECEKHKGEMETHICETCQNAICIECKTEHDPTHLVYHLQEMGQKLILQFSKEDDTILFQELCKLDNELEAEASKVKNWFAEAEKKILAAIKKSVTEVMNDILGSGTVRIGEKRKELEELLKMKSDEKEQIQEEIKELITDEDYKGIYKYKDLYFKGLKKEDLMMEALSEKPKWIDHVKKVKGVSEDILKDTLNAALQDAFSTPLLHILPNKSNQITVYNPVTGVRTIHKVDGMIRSRHFDTVMIKNFIYIIGGNDDEHKVLLKNNYQYEILGDKGDLTKKADMLKGRFAHRLVAPNEHSIYALGGVITSFLGTKYTNNCEKYDRFFDKWVEIKPMFDAKGYITSCIFKNRFIYVLGGFNDDNAFESSAIVEFFDSLLESDGWKQIKFENINNAWVPSAQAGAIQVGRNNLMIFGGRKSKSQLTSDCFVYSLRDNTMKMMEAKLWNPTCYFQRNVMSFNDEVYCIDSIENNLHVFSQVELKWRCVKKPEWDKISSQSFIHSHYCYCYG